LFDEFYSDKANENAKKNNLLFTKKALRIWKIKSKKEKPINGVCGQMVDRAVQKTA